ncbi:MAG: hypothetical protein A2W44_03110 [Acinetobacter sp. RIFCSPHIGHO2_12_41_5]|nr:MAG: hypothetical protein A2W44_03110 [Acinetobacter sp. RIFCSPHIGHO2_12_41_5]
MTKKYLVHNLEEKERKECGTDECFRKKLLRDDEKIPFLIGTIVFLLGFIIWLLREATRVQYP